MGKGSGVFCAMLFSCLLLTGCAENPTEDIVVNKNEGKLEQAIQRENKKDSDTSVPEKYTDQFQADGEKIEVSVDVFAVPECFLRSGDHILVFPMASDPDACPF